MIQIQLSEDEFQYDVYTLTKAFFSMEDVKVQIGIGEKNQKEETFIIVKYKETQVELTIKEKGSIVAQGSVEFTGIDRKEKKNRLKRLLYAKLAEYTGKELPWGNLTGIRPIKIVMAMLEKGNGREETIENLKKIYCISQEKAELSVEIAQRELSVLNTFDYKNGYSLYIGIPFCPTTCLYCSFTSYPIALWQKHTGEYLNALYKELTYISKVMSHRRLDSVYIGGGPPTTLSP